MKRNPTKKINQSAVKYQDEYLKNGNGKSSIEDHFKAGVKWMQEELKKCQTK